MVLDVLLVLDAGDSEKSHGPVQSTHHHFKAVGISNHNNVGEAQLLGILVDLWELEISPRIICYIMKNHHQLAHEVVDLSVWLKTSSDEHLDLGFLGEEFIELI